MPAQALQGLLPLGLVGASSRPGSELAPGWVTARVSILQGPGLAPAVGPWGLRVTLALSWYHQPFPCSQRLCWGAAPQRSGLDPGPPSLATPPHPVEAPPSMCPSIWVTGVARDTTLVPCRPSLPARPPWLLLLPESRQALSPKSGGAGLVTLLQEAP